MKLEKVSSGGVTSPMGFKASGVTCGLKKSGKSDLAMLYSEKDCSVAGTFTSNLFPAAPVVWCRKLVSSRAKARAVVVNSGVANACTGLEGMANVEKTAEYAGKLLGVARDSVFVSSTGRIGVQLPMDKIFAGTEAAVKALSSDGSLSAAEAIMTTDTVSKSLAVSFLVDGKRVTVGGMTKGAGMIAPGMRPAVPHATMLCYVTTDAEVSEDDLTKFLSSAVENSFNRISVDNDMSTNDTCLLFANGASGVKISFGKSEASSLFAEAVTFITQTLAKKMVMDGEGSTKFVTVSVTGAATQEDAEKCARSIADSMLCKTAWFGCDPNWGRVLAAAGYSGAKFSPENVSLDYDEMKVVRGGMDAGTPETALAEVMKRREFAVKIDLGAGKFSAVRWTSDISHEYVTINADYHT